MACCRLDFKSLDPDAMPSGGYRMQGCTEWMAWLSSGPSRMAEVPLSMTTDVAATATGLPLMLKLSSATVQYLQTGILLLRFAIAEHDSS